jgi:hypothetical protein
MQKTARFTVRLPESDMKRIEGIAKAAGMPVSSFIRMMLLAGDAEKTQSSQDADRLENLENAVRDLAAIVAESVRVPSFFEYRVRQKVDGLTKPAGESELDFLIRQARMYYSNFRVWPDPADAAKFGGLPAGVQATQWPKAPPV